MSDERLGEPFDEIPTMKEQGIDLVGYNWRGFYTGGEVSDEAYDWWVNMLGELYESPAWQETAEQHGLTPIWRGGEEFEKFVHKSIEDTREVSREIGVIK